MSTACIINRYLALLLMLSGCVSVYEPKIVDSAVDHDQYDADLKSCRKNAQDRVDKAGDSPDGIAKNSLAGAFGIAGVLVGAMIPSDNEDYNKSGFIMVDECMAKKGYILSKNSIN